MAFDSTALSNIQIGFSLGCFWRDNEPKEILKFLREKGIKTVELKVMASLDQVGGTLSSYRKEEFDGFSFTSYHAPKFAYGKNEETKKFLREMDQLHELHPLNLLVVHPDIVEEVSVFNNLPFPVGFENMDTQKKS